MFERENVLNKNIIWTALPRKIFTFKYNLDYIVGDDILNLHLFLQNRDFNFNLGFMVLDNIYEQKSNI